MLNTEIWKDIPDYPNYEVSSLGKVRNKKTGKVLAQNTDGKGHYLHVALWKNNVGVTKNVHPLVAKAFVPNPEGKPEVNHKDGNKRNNAADNLEWVTMKENRQHASKMGLYESMKHRPQRDKQANASSRYRYVFWDKARWKWTARLKVDRKTINLGRYDSEIEAAKIADKYIEENGLKRRKNFS